MECVICWEKYFWWLRRFKNLRSTTCKHRRKYYRKCDVIYRYLHIELIGRLLLVQYLQNNVMMIWTTRFIRFTGCIPLKYGSTTTPPIIAHCKKNCHVKRRISYCDPKTSNIRRIPSFDLLTVEFSKQVSICTWKSQRIGTSNLMLMLISWTWGCTTFHNFIWMF